MPVPEPLPAWGASESLPSRLALASCVAVALAGCAGPPAAHGGDRERCRRASDQ